MKRTTNPAEYEVLADVAVKLRGATHLDKGVIVKAAAERLGVSAQTLYRRLSAHGLYSAGRKQREDRGDCALSLEEARKISAYLMAGIRRNGKRIVSVQQALEDLRANGAVKAERVDQSTGEVTRLSASYVATRLRELGMSTGQLRRPAPTVQLQSLHPNHVWQIDASVCVLFYLPKKGLQVMKEDEFYKNKPHNFKRIENDRVIRYVCTDHASGAIMLRYYKGAETSENLSNFFIHCIQPKDAENPIHGVPVALMDDPGSANTGYLFKNLVARLLIQHLTHEAGAANVTGSVEKGQDLVERNFESRLGVGTQVADFDEPNALATKWCAWFNATRVHSRHGKSRYSAWLSISKEQLRLAPPREICEMLLTTKPEQRTVNGRLQISYVAVKGEPSRTYDVSHVPNVMVGEKLMVCVNPYAAPNIHVIAQGVGADGKPKNVYYDCKPIVVNEWGFNVDAAIIGEEFKSHAATLADQNRQANERIAYSAENDQQVEEAKRKKQRPFADVDAFKPVKEARAIGYLPRGGTDMGIETPVVEVKPMTHFEALRALRARGIEITPDRNALLQSQYPSGVREDELDAAEDLLINGAGQPSPASNVLSPSFGRKVSNA